MLLLPPLSGRRTRAISVDAKENQRKTVIIRATHTFLRMRQSLRRVKWESEREKERRGILTGRGERRRWRSRSRVRQTITSQNSRPDVGSVFFSFSFLFFNEGRTEDEVLQRWGPRVHFVLRFASAGIYYSLLEQRCWEREYCIFDFNFCAYRKHSNKIKFMKLTKSF